MVGWAGPNARDVRHMAVCRTLQVVFVLVLRTANVPGGQADTLKGSGEHAIGLFWLHFARKKQLSCSLYRLFKVGFRHGQLVAVFRPPHIQGRQQENAQQQGANQAPDDDDGKRPL
jgi:hypothetical protein